MFERFTNQAREVMSLANESARRFGHGRIGTEHIFLGLIKEGHGRGAQVLQELGVDTQQMLAEIEQLAPKAGRNAADDNYGQTPAAVQVITYAVEEARSLNDDHIGTEHILLGLLREGQGIAAVVLSNLGITLESVRMSLAE